jgi:hypothetical protein
VNKTIKNTKDVLKRMEEILNQAGEPSKAKPNAIQLLLARAKLGKKE